MWLIKEIWYHRIHHYLTVAANAVAIFLVLIMNILSATLTENLADHLNSLGLDVSMLQMVDPSLLPPEWIDTISEKLGAEKITPFYSKSLDGFTVSCCNQHLAGMFDFIMEKGRFISGLDILNNDNVAVLGYQAAAGLNDPAIGSEIEIDSVSFKVIGIIEQTEGSLFIDIDNSVFLPEGYFSELQQVSCYFSGGNDSTLVLDEVLGRDNYLLVSQGQLGNVTEAITELIRSVLLAVAAISLIVAVIGLVNSTLSSIRARTYEIGVKKVLGAGDSDIFIQFLTEMAIILTVSAAIAITAVGLIVGTLKAYGMAEIVIDYQENSVMLFRMLLLGLVCGLYPAKKAAGITIMEAIRSQ